MRKESNGSPHHCLHVLLARNRVPLIQGVVAIATRGSVPVNERGPSKRRRNSPREKDDSGPYEGQTCPLARFARGRSRVPLAN